MPLLEGGEERTECACLGLDAALDGAREALASLSSSNEAELALTVSLLAGINVDAVALGAVAIARTLARALDAIRARRRARARVGAAAGHSRSSAAAGLPEGDLVSQAKVATSGGFTSMMLLPHLLAVPQVQVTTGIAPVHVESNDSFLATEGGNRLVNSGIVALIRLLVVDD